MSDKQFIEVRWRCQINSWICTYFLKMDQYIFFNRVTLVININRECLLKEYKFKNKNHTRVRKQRSKVYMGRDILCSVDQIQGDIGRNLKIDQWKRHLCTEHLFSAQYILVSEIAQEIYLFFQSIPHSWSPNLCQKYA